MIERLRDAAATGGSDPGRQATLFVARGDPSWRYRLRLAAFDLLDGMRQWRIWLLLGLNDIRQRYRRSQLGQFWLTLSMAISIAALGVVYSYLFKIDTKLYLPYLTASLVTWTLIGNTTQDLCTAFITADGYLRQMNLPKTVFVFRIILRNLIVFSHNVVILPVVFFIFDVPFGWEIVAAVAGLAIIALNAIWVGLLVGTLSTRFRDLPLIVASLMQIAFFVTPVIWKQSQMGGNMTLLVDLNPLAALLSLVRDPLLGHMAPAWSWQMAAGLTATGFAVAIPFFAWFRSRIVYWL